MKKTININLGGQPFIIDEPAFDILHGYFEALKLKFTNESEQKEIISDIESRTAELFSERLGKNRAVVGEEDVVYVISLMGRPEDIAGDTDTTAAPQDTKVAATTSTGRAEKKLFRDPDDKKVGGVISGLCHYFGWADPTWVRIAVIALIAISIFTKISFGFPIAVIYLILLVVVPEAATSAEKLQMQGKPVTLQNIEKEVRDAMTTAGQSVHTLIKDDSVGGRIAAVLVAVLRGLGRITLVAVIFICVILMIALVTSFFGLSMLSSASLTDITHLLVYNRYIIMLFNIGLMLTIGIPLVAVMYDAIRLLTGNRGGSTSLRRALWAVWFVGLLVLGFTTWSVLRDFVASDTMNDKVQLVTPKSGTLHIQMADTLGRTIELHNDDNEDGPSSLIHISGLAKTAYGFSFSDLKLEIAVSPDSNFYVERVAFSKGTNFADAGKNIQMIKYRFSQTDSILNLDDKFEIPKEGKWRGQKVKIRLYVPEGKRVTFADNVDQIEASVKGNDYFDDGEMSNKTLEVEKGKIKCTNCKEKMITEEGPDDAPEAPEAPEEPTPPAGPGTTTTTNTTTHSNVKISTGDKSDDLKDVTVNINQNGIVVRGKNNKSESVKVSINEKGLHTNKIDSQGNVSKVK